jgi:hypothetical protein
VVKSIAVGLKVRAVFELLRAWDHAVGRSLRADCVCPLAPSAGLEVASVPLAEVFALARSAAEPAAPVSGAVAADTRRWGA